MDKEQKKVNSKKVFIAILNLAHRRGLISEEELQELLESERLRDNPKMVRKDMIKRAEPD